MPSHASTVTLEPRGVAMLERHIRTITDIPCGSNVTLEPHARPLLPVQCFERDFQKHDAMDNAVFFIDFRTAY
jgi:hypothetical protein